MRDGICPKNAWRVLENLSLRLCVIKLSVKGSSPTAILAPLIPRKINSNFLPFKNALANLI